MNNQAPAGPRDGAGGPWLLTGGSGLIGQALAAALAGSSIACMRATRQPPKHQPAPGAIQWDPQSVQPFEDPSWIEGLDVAVHLSGANVAGQRWTPAYKQEILTSRTQTTGALSRALAGLRRPPRLLIVASATGYYGNRGECVLTEQDAPGTDFLARTCVAWEAAASPAVAAGIRVVRLRLGVVLTPQGGALAKVLPLFRAGLGGRLGGGRQWMSWITLEDAVRAIMHIAGFEDNTSANGRLLASAPSPDGLAGAVNCVTPSPVTNAEYTRVLAATLHRPALIPAPAFALRLALGEMADAAVLSSCRAAPERLLASGFRFRFPELGGALAHLLSPTRP